MTLRGFARYFGPGLFPCLGNYASGVQVAGTGWAALRFLAIEGPSGGSTGIERAEGSAYVMGTIFSIVAYGHHIGRLESAIRKALNEAKRLDQRLSNYRPESELSRLNRSAGRRPTKVSIELFQLLSACAEYSRDSEGTFDITAAPLMRIFGFYKGTGRLPDRKEIAQALKKVGYQNVLLDPERRTVRFAQAGLELDPGGIGKGFAVDKMAAILKHGQVHSALISAGGSTIYGLGTPPHQPGWKVSIKDPRRPSKTIESVSLKDESISTSGDYEKSFWSDGKIWGHIMDPRTGYPATGMLSVSVIAPRALDSEAWTKPYYILGRAWTERRKPANFKVFCCENDPEKPCAWL